MSESYADFLDREYPTALDPSLYITDLISRCDIDAIHYLDGFFIDQGLDPEDPKLSPAYLIYDILIQDGEMPYYEALLLTTKTIQCTRSPPPVLE